MHTEYAPAKVNLTLHVTGKRADGYHQLQSLVMFAHDVADRLTFSPTIPNTSISLEITGEFASSLWRECPDVTKNLVWRAAKILQDAYHVKQGAHICLEKHLPSQAGLGGGSADAAAVLRGLNQCWGLGLGKVELAHLGESLGADVPMCVYAQALIAEGVGNEISLLNKMPSITTVLVKPDVAVSTPDVFRALDWSAAEQQDVFPQLSDAWKVADWARYLAATRNDLMAPSMQLAPEIQSVIQALERQRGCICARMSGSGSACFGVFVDAVSAEVAVQLIQCHYPSWWARLATLS